MGTVSANPTILKWARETCNYSVEDIANKMGQDVAVIQAWENGQKSPTYPQLEKLAHDYYKRPVAVFFFPQPPVIESTREQLRTVPGFEYDRLSPRVLQLMRRAQAMIINLEELTDGVNPTRRHIVRDLPSPDRNVPISQTAAVVRNYIGVSLREQIRWPSAEVAMDQWREALSDCGVFVFKDAFRDNGVSGFCIHDAKFPVIYINNSMPKTRQIFTLFHELGHLLFRTGGIAKVVDDYLPELEEGARYVEVFCNAFSAEFLVPSGDFDPQVASHEFLDIPVEMLAKRYSVSREVILGKLLDRGLINQELYRRLADEWTSEVIVPDEDGGGNYYNTTVTYLGNRYLDLAFGRYYRNQISVYALSEYLGVKVINIPKLEAAWAR